MMKGNNMEELKEKVEMSLKATDADDVYSVGMRNAFRLVLSYITGEEPKYENYVTWKQNMSKEETGLVIDWLQEIIGNHENWKEFYSDSEVKTLAENALKIIKFN